MTTTIPVVHGMAQFVDYSVESVLVVRGVVHLSNVTVRLHQLVVTFDYVTVPRLVLALDVVRVRIVHFVLELVVRRRLRKHNIDVYKRQ